MPESNFDIDRLGMLTLQHFEHVVERGSSCGENNYSSSELHSNASSPSYFTDGSESPISSPTELNFSVKDKFWERNEEKEVSVLSENNNLEKNLHQLQTCRYRRGRRGKDTVSKRNERERRRVRLISEGFGELRKHLMIPPGNRKLPKLQILRKAILYIQNLEDMIRESDLQNSSAGNRTPLSYLYDSSFMNNRSQNTHTTYVNTPALKGRDIHYRDPQLWL